MLTKYNDFKFNVNENVQQAKAYLKNRALKLKREKDPGTPEKPTGLSPQEVKSAENNPDFLKIKDLVKENPGYTYLFTKFFFEEQVPLDALKDLFRTINSSKQLLGNLPMEITRYAALKATDEDQRGAYERLCDDLDSLQQSRTVSKFVEQLLPFQKELYKKATLVQKEKIQGIATAFDEFGKESDGKKDMALNKSLQDLFFSKIKSLKSLADIITAATAHIKSSTNTGMSKFLGAIQKANTKFGESNGAEIVYNDNGILIIDVKSYQTNNLLNANTSHCIAKNQYHWDSYVGSDSNFNKQYYIYNFNLSPSDNNSVIGITIEQNGGIRACHQKNDSSFGSSIKQYMKSINVPFDVLAPMTKEEVEKKKRRVIANKEIVKDKLSTAEVKKFYEDGGDPNAATGKPLQNAVKEDNIEKAKYLLSVGAQPNIGQAIKLCKGKDMIILLVENGAEVTADVFKGVMEDYDAVEYLLKAGMDPNFESGFPLRMASKVRPVEKSFKLMDLLLKYGALLEERRWMVVKWVLEHGEIGMADYILDKLEKSPKFKSLTPDERTKFMSDLLHWTKTTDKVNDSSIIDKMVKKIEAFKSKFDK